MARGYEEEEESEEETGSIEESYTPPSKDESRWMYDYNEIYKQIRLSLLGLREEYDKKKGWITVKDSEPLLPEKAVSEIMTLIKGYVNKVTGLTYLNEERVLDLCHMIYIDLAEFLLMKRKEYELTPEKATQVLNIIISIIETNLRKSIGGFGMRIIGVTEKVVEHRVEPKKKLWPF